MNIKQQDSKKKGLRRDKRKRRGEEGAKPRAANRRRQTASTLSPVRVPAPSKGHLFCLFVLFACLFVGFPASWKGASDAQRSVSSSLFLPSGLRLAEQLGRREDEAKVRHRLGLSLWAGGNLEEAQHQVGVCVRACVCVCVRLCRSIGVSRRGGNGRDGSKSCSRSVY